MRGIGRDRPRKSRRHKRMNTDKLALSVTEAAALLGVSRPTVYTLIHRADFPAFKLGIFI